MPLTPTPLTTFSAPSLTGDASVLEFRGSEALCRPYRFDIHLRVSGASMRDVDDRAAIGSAATLKLQRGLEGMPFVVQGVLSHVSVLLETADWALYKVSLVPRLWRLGLTRHSRVFTRMTVPDIMAEVLESAGLSQGSDFEMRLHEDYAIEELVSMYSESKLSFLHRWLEREGIVYFFEHDPAEGGVDKLVLADHASAHAALTAGAVPYRPLADDDDSAGACFDTFAMLRDAVVGAVKLSDYDYARPALDLSAEHAASEQGFGQAVQHLGRFFDPEQAKRYAQLRAEAIQSREVTFHVGGYALHLSAGWLAEVAEHARDAFNRRYLIYEVQHMGNQLGEGLPPRIEQLISPLTDRAYRTEARMVGSDTPFRPQQTTPWPRVSGYENGVVDGPAESGYAQVDDQGRYLVRMHFDESELEDGKRSTYVRMMQPHGGKTEGFHFPLRKGTEVKLGFDEGDPDRPFIAGVVPNATSPSPITEANHTKNIIATGGGNLITIEDEVEKQQFRFYSPVEETQMWMGDKKFVDADAGLPDRLGGELPAFPGAHLGLASKGNAAFWFGGDWWSNTGGVRVDIVQGDVTELYLTNQTEDVGSDQIVNVGGSRADYVGSGVAEIYGSFHDTKVNGPRKEEAGPVEEKYASLNTSIEGRWANSAAESFITSGLTTLKFGPTMIDWGATTGIVNALFLNIPGGGQITSPDLKFINPNRSEDGVAIKAAWASSINFTGFSTSNIGLYVSGKVASVARTGASFNRVGVQNSSHAVDVANGGPHIANIGMMLRQAAIHVLS